MTEYQTNAFRYALALHFDANTWGARAPVYSHAPAGANPLAWGIWWYIAE